MYPPTHGPVFKILWCVYNVFTSIYTYAIIVYFITTQIQTYVYHVYIMNCMEQTCNENK